MNQSISKKYENIISFGCMCSLALHLKELGLRSKSCFFDWVNCESINNNIRLVLDNFNGVFDKTYFVQKYTNSPHIVTNAKYKIDFVHLFNAKITLKKQYSRTKERVERSIRNFYNSANNNCLLIYYSRDENEKQWIISNQDVINSFCKKFNCDIAFVFSYKFDDFLNYPKFIISENNIHKPFGGPVSYPFDGTVELDNFLLSHYDEHKRQKNLSYKKRKSIFKKIGNFMYRFRKVRLIIK